MFSRGRKTSCTPWEEAVAGMSCMRPQAPFDETARRLKSDSSRIIALTSAYSTPWRAAISRMRSSYAVGSVAATRAHERQGDGPADHAERGGSLKKRDGGGGLVNQDDRGGSVKKRDGGGGLVNHDDGR